MPENPRWPSYHRCRICHHYERNSIHDPDHELTHEFISTEPGEIPQGFKTPEAIRAAVQESR